MTHEFNKGLTVFLQATSNIASTSLVNSISLEDTHPVAVEKGAMVFQKKLRLKMNLYQV